MGSINLDSIEAESSKAIAVDDLNLIVSNFSSIWCVADHLITAQVSASVTFGNHTTQGTNLIQWVSGDGQVGCEVSDYLGNSVQKWFNLTYVTNDLEISSNIVNGYGNITKQGVENFEVNASSDFQLTELEVSSGNFSLLETNNGSLVVNLSNEGFVGGGTHSITITARNALGYHLNHTFELTLDNTPPLVCCTGGHQYILEQSQDILHTAPGL